jgi:hypothetical protein
MKNKALIFFTMYMYLSCSHNREEFKETWITPKLLITLLVKNDKEITNELILIDGNWRILQQEYYATSWENTKYGQLIVKSSNYILYSDATEKCMDNYDFLLKNANYQGESMGFESFSYRNCSLRWKMEEKNSILSIEKTQ